MDIFSSYNLIIEVSVIIIISFIFNAIAKKTNIPAVILLILLGVGLQYGINSTESKLFDFLPILELLGIVGLIMIVLEAALELELKKESIVPIFKSMMIALVGLLASAAVAAWILFEFIPEMTWASAWIYATPLGILSSAIIIPSVSGLTKTKKEFHVYESTFSDILGIMMFYFLKGPFEAESGSSGGLNFATSLILTIVISLVASYAIILIFQRITSPVKLFVLIAVLLLLYAIGKSFHLSALIIILIFGLIIANMKLFFKGKLKSFLNYEKAHQIYHELHIITAETAFVVRTFFFVVFGITIAIGSLFNKEVAIISSLIIVSIFILRFILLRVTSGKDIIPQVFIAPRGLITVLLFYDIPKEAIVKSFEPGILLFVILGTSIIMTLGMIYNKSKSGVAVKKSQNDLVKDDIWKAPDLNI